MKEKKYGWFHNVSGWINNGDSERNLHSVTDPKEIYWTFDFIFNKGSPFYFEPISSHQHADWDIKWQTNQTIQWNLHQCKESVFHLKIYWTWMLFENRSSRVFIPPLNNSYQQRADCWDQSRKNGPLGLLEGNRKDFQPEEWK